MLSYPVTIEREKGQVLVDFPDFPEAHTYGDDLDEALVRASDALATIMEAYIRDRQRIPKPSRVPRARRVQLPALIAAKVELYQAMLDSGMTKTELARRLNWHLPQVDRLFDVHHGSKLEQIEAAAFALGKQFSIVMVDRTELAIGRFEARNSFGAWRPRSGAATGIAMTIRSDRPKARKRRRSRVGGSRTRSK
jgi:antitoxin HicB